MKKTIVTFGLISGAISSVMMIATVPLAKHGSGSLVLGYTTIVLSLLLVFFGIRAYRDNQGNGQISFGKAFAVGISITVISCLCYVITWEVLSVNFYPDFADKYAAQVIEKAKASGASRAALEAKIQEMNKFKQQYKNPFFRLAMTFIEPFPVGLLITLISAAILRKNPQATHASLATSS